MFGWFRAEAARASLSKRRTLRGVGRYALGQDLQGDVPRQARVPRAIDLSHAARAELPPDLVAADPAAGLRRGGGALLTHRLCTDSVETPPT